MLLKGYHTADSDTDSSISRGDLHYMAVQNRFGSGRQVKSTREALKKLNRNRSFNGQHSQQLGGTPKHTPAGPLKADHTIQPFIHNDRLQDSCLQDQWKEQGARPKYSSTESLETESVNHEVFPDTAIRSDSEDHRGSRSSLNRHSRTASPCRSVHFEDEEVRRPTNGDLRKSASFNSDYDRTLTENEGLVSDYVRYGRRHSENGGCLRDRGTVMLHDGSVGDVFINGGTDSDAMDHVQRHQGQARERSERSSRRSQSVNGDGHRNIGSGRGAMDNGYEISSTKGGRYDNNSGANSSGVGRKDRSNSEVREDGISIREEGDRNGRVDLRTPRSRSPFVKSISHDGHYPLEGGHVHLVSGGVTEEAENGDKIQNDNLEQLQGAIEPEYEEIKRAKKTYSTHANSYYDAIQAHSAWDEYKRKLQEEKEQKRRAGPFADLSSFSRNQDHLSKMSGSNLSIASNSSISEKMQHLGHATKQTFGRMRRALSLDKINRNSQKDDGFDKGSKLKRSPSLRSMSSFFGRKKDKLMGSFSDLSTRERRSASISGPSSAVMEQIDVTTPSYMRKIGRVLEVYDDGTRLVRLVKPPNGPFGFYIAKGASTNGPGIFVKRIGDGHPAKILAGLLQVGDEILEINGHNVKIEKNIDTVYDLILDNDDLVLRVRPLIRRGTELS
ncbi:hypothetical protein BSL78_02233 [Apostichopus japonicus]|uniref:PDZ domain-containing protein n=1 Tax=Stichopus japonicus TaxID=307972 RepID=A0A2G8LKQ5_STIJA|nr:hypothetical protein BSL78_02233 [Apostichopus japonicus]